ncbi:sensor domain-containing diguanylate cyclase [Halodesulfovibrio spirochaetisodalis]|uniref:Diguanylate cyclase n=1 Tax=Halodesulfovibrio spirochaetisodalis TaxID=1560234 RepID=A0A1B7XQB2_9BACT|nr:sensor domain-containing diguanylate cyclase [Halodesulfovibrio spirochaetisodalis]OBQ57666.1 hypothetical protein SP90_01135 [Halodesulfovibrio spirochaetisodalis]
MAVTGSTKKSLLILEHDTEAVLGSMQYLAKEEYQIVSCGASEEELRLACKENPHSVFVVNADNADTVTFLSKILHGTVPLTVPVICCAAKLDDIVCAHFESAKIFAWISFSSSSKVFECSVNSALEFSSVQAKHTCAIEKYKLIAQNIPESVVMLNEEWCIDFANEHLGQLAGAADPLEGRHIKTLLDSETLMRLQAVSSRLDVSEKQNFQGYVVTVHEEMVPVWFSVSRIAEGNNLLCVMTNLEENLQAEAALREAEAKYRALYLNAAEGMFRIEESGRIIEANPAFNRIFGFEVLDWSASSLSNNFLDRFVSVADFRNLMGEVQTVGRQSKFTAQLLRRDGTPIWGEISAHWSVDPKNQVPYVEGILSDVTERRRAELDLQHKATRDCLTGVYSRGYFYEKLNSILACARYEGTNFAVLYLDFNDFKNVNDTHGHHCGDIVIKELVKRIGTHIRERDVFGRIGGDEFCIVLENVRSVSDVGVVVEKIHAAADAPIQISPQHAVSVGLSVGVALYPEDGDTPDVLLQRADQAMYLEKRS